MARHEMGSTASRLAAAVLAMGLGLAACGGDEPAVTGSGDEGAVTTVGTENVQAYCEKVLAIETLEEGDVDFEALTPEQQKEEAKKFARDVISPLAKEAQAVTPASIKADIDILVAAVDKVAETGDFEAAFEGNPATEEASMNAHRFDLANCGWKQTDVRAVEYAFSGVPATLPTGTTSFELDNGGKEQHEMVLFRKNDGVTDSVDSLLKLPEEEAEKKVSVVGQTEAVPGEDGMYLVVDLTPGSYAMVCFLPVGSTPEAIKAAEDADRELEGPPHFTRGMKAEFTVA